MMRTMVETPANLSDRTKTPVRSGRIWGVLVIVAVAGAVFAVILLWQQDSPEACYQRGRKALIEGDRDAVLRASEQLIRTSAYRPQGCLLKGLLLARGGKMNEAISRLQEAATKESLAVEAYTLLSRCYYESGQYVQAIDTALAALVQDATALEARRWLAAAYYDLGAVAQATRELEQVSQEDPKDPYPDRLLGLIAKDSELYPKAISHYRKSLQRAPHQSGLDDLLIEMAESQVKVDQFDEALITLKDCSKSAVSLTLEASCHSALGHIEMAEDRLRQAVLLDPHSSPAKLAQGKILLDRGQPAEAAEILNEARRFNAYDRQVHFQLSQAYRSLGKIAEADAELDIMLEIQRQEREFSDLHDQAASQPEDAEIRYRIGELANRLGKPKLAVIWFRAALAIDPNHARSRTALNKQTRG